MDVTIQTKRKKTKRRTHFSTATAATTTTATITNMENSHFGVLTTAPHISRHKANTRTPTKAISMPTAVSGLPYRLTPLAVRAHLHVLTVEVAHAGLGVVGCVGPRPCPIGLVNHRLNYSASGIDEPGEGEKEDH